MDYSFKRLILLFLCSLGLATAHAGPRAIFDYKIFYSPQTGPYIETYLKIDGNSIRYTYNADSLLQGEVAILMIFRQNDSIVFFDKKVLLTPENADSSFVDFMDQQRYSLPNGTYMLELELRDPNVPNQRPEVFSQPLTIAIPLDEVAISDIQLVAGYKKSDSQSVLTKAGYDLIPYLYEEVPLEMNELIIYSEVYNSKTYMSDSVFAVSYYFASDTDSIIRNTQRYLRKSVADVVPLLLRVSLAGLPEGKLRFVLEARNSQNAVVTAKSIDLIRIGTHGGHDLASSGDFNEESFVLKYTDAEKLHYYISSLYPIAGDVHQQYISAEFKKNYKEKLPQMQEFLWDFWAERNPENPAEAWREYLRQVEFVEQQFGTQNKAGFETDRGIAYLKYGAPDNIAARPSEPNSYPYQIWQYYRADKWNNVKMIFYDPQLTGRDYVLLHVEGIPGELRNPQWKGFLQSRTRKLDRNKSDENNNYGSEVDQLWRNPQ